MTLTELLERVINSFDILYFDEPTKLEALLRNSILIYQEKAGFKVELAIPDTDAEIALPDDVYKIITVRDDTGKFHLHNIADSKIVITENDDSVKPYKVIYFADLNSVEMDATLPKECIGLVMSHFIQQVKIRNVKRERQLVKSVGDDPDLPSEESMETRLLEIEQDMSDNMAILPSIMVW